MDFLALEKTRTERKKERQKRNYPPIRGFQQKLASDSRGSTMIKSDENRSDSQKPQATRDDLRILASIGSDAKSIQEISEIANIPVSSCDRLVVDFVDLGLIVRERDSDLYGHELIKFRRVPSYSSPTGLPA
jgi:hypothetical protein